MIKIIFNGDNFQYKGVEQIMRKRQTPNFLRNSVKQMICVLVICYMYSIYYIMTVDYAFKATNNTKPYSSLHVVTYLLFV